MMDEEEDEYNDFSYQPESIEESAVNSKSIKDMKHTIEDVRLTIEPEFRMLHNRIGVFNTHFQNFGHCNIPKAQLIFADPPYCYDEETECFTRNGWKRYTELNYDD